MIQEQQIEQIFAIITSNGIKERSGHAELLNTLQTVIKVRMYICVFNWLTIYVTRFGKTNHFHELNAFYCSIIILHTFIHYI